MEESKSKPLSYDSLKSVLKYTSFEKREEIHRRIPQLRKTNAIIPYQLRSVTFLPELHIFINDLVWEFEEVLNEQLSLPENEKCTLTLRDFIHEFYAEPIILDKSPKDAFEALLKTFIKDETTIQHFHVEHVPQYIFNQKPETFKLKVSELKIGSYFREDFNKLFPYIDEKTLKLVDLSFIDNNERLLDVSLIKNCPNLGLGWIRDEAAFPWDRLHLFRNNKLKIIHSEFPRNRFQAFLLKWRGPDRPIGSTFFMLILGSNKDLVYDIKVKLNEFLDFLTKHHEAVPSKLPDDLSIKRCVTMKMTNDNDSELVVYTKGEAHRHSSLTMKIMHAGTTTILDE